MHSITSHVGGVLRRAVFIIQTMCKPRFYMHTLYAGVELVSG